ncbi:F-box/FBD/LRR-repeat protein At1g13570-like [Mercurialis annua]|uniref:F-box/FBD/LRR-repeat protein At1g13570-like n=1 Tax=Mercurialis annua TaxID=3986 RepID=UPI0024ACDE74|nr:F-box/FBD/LRR-repeat protein At1g13570-like [Mercurialis annua]
MLSNSDSHITKKTRNSSRPDLISNLPTEIINIILTCLPINEAVKTSILSKKWRFNWRYLSKLVFDETFYQTSALTSNAKPNTTKLFSNINKVLLLHKEPINITLKFPLFQMYPEIDQLMLFLSEKDVHEISFYIGRSFLSEKDRRVPPFLFSCVILRSLTLSSCSFTVPLAFQGFVNLISLKFQWVRFKNNAFEILISKCPLLETLSIRSCPNSSYLDIDLPYLKFFYFSGSFESICFRKTSQHLSTIFYSLTLYYCVFFDKYFGTIPRKLSATLACLTVLVLPEICFRRTTEVSAVVCLILSSPNLQKLEIGSVAYNKDEKEVFAQEIYKVEDLLDNALKKLRLVRMKLSKKKDIRPELEFIKFLLAGSIVLEKMVIQPALGTVAEKGRQKILKKIIRFHRSSENVEILYLNCGSGGAC